MLRQRLNDELKESMKLKASRRVATIRLILAAIKDRDICLRGEGGGGTVDDDTILEILQKMVKQRRDSVQAFEEGGRLELAEQEREEVEIIGTFMPEQLSDAELEAVCEKAVAELEAKSLKDIGRVMAYLKENYAGRMDFAKASAKIKKLLS